MTQANGHRQGMKVVVEELGMSVAVGAEPADTRVPAAAGASEADDASTQGHDGGAA